MEIPELDTTTLAVTVPFMVYWVMSAFYEYVSRVDAPWIQSQKMFSNEEEGRLNRVSRTKVFFTVVAQHLLQSVGGLILLEQAPDVSNRTYLGEVVRFAGAVVVMDTWQFSWHRLLHEVPWLYRHVHSWHHCITVPYSFAALYQHPVEMILMDTLSGLISVEATGCSPRTAMIFWSLSYMKTVSDHSNFGFPVNPFFMPGWNNAAYHAVHHDPKGLKVNYSQPFFTFWDRVYGCYRDPRQSAPVSVKSQKQM